MAEGRPSERGILEIADDAGNVFTGHNRLRLGPGLSASINPADPSIVINATGITSLVSGVNVDTVADLRALSALTMAVARHATTSGYSVKGDGGCADYDWDSTSTATDDGALVIKVTAVSTGRWKFRMPADKIFPLSACAIDKTGATVAGNALTTLFAALYAAGYRGVDATGCNFNLSTQDITLPGRAEGERWEIIKGTYDGSGASFVGGIIGGISVESGSTGSGNVNPLGIVYGTRTWTETVKAGQLTMHNVADIRNLSAGTTVYVRLGAVPTDASGLPDMCYYAKVVSTTPTTGNAGHVTLDRQAPETPPYPLPSYNINFTRLGNQHDMFVVTSFQDNVTIREATFRKVHISVQYARELKVIRPHWTYSSACMSIAYCEHVKVESPWAEIVKGLDSLSNYGWCFLINGCWGFVVSNLRIDKFSAAQGILNDEVHSRGIQFTGLTQVIIDNTDNLTIGGVFSTPYTNEPISFDNLFLEGGGSTVSWANNMRIRNLHIADTLQLNTALPEWQFFSANQVSEVIYYRGVEFRSRRHVRLILSGIPVNGSKSFQIPEHGIIRHVRVYSSSLTGVTGLTFDCVSPSLTGGNQVSMLVANRTVYLNEPANLWYASPAWVGNQTQITVTTDGSFPAATYFYVEVEVLADEGVLGLPLTNDTSVPEIIASNGAPSVNAGFVGQVCFDYTNKVWYDAVSTGTGSSDWKLRGGSAGALLAANNLSDVASASTSRTNLGLGSAATQASTAFDAAGAAAAAQAASQPLDSDLTAIAALATSSYGRDFLTLANAAALLAKFPNSGTSAGRVKIPVEIDRVSVSGATVVTFNTWAAGLYREIIVEFTGSLSAAVYAGMQINGHTDAVYEDQGETITGGTAAADNAAVGTNGHIRVCKCASSPGSGHFRVNFYPLKFGTNRRRTVDYVGHMFDNGGTDANKCFRSGAGAWNDSSTDVTNISFVTSDGSSTYTGEFFVWGVPA